MILINEHMMAMRKAQAVMASKPAPVIAVKADMNAKTNKPKKKRKTRKK
jgi:hypothetical protein